MNYDQQNRFYNHALKIVEKMGGDICMGVKSSIMNTGCQKVSFHIVRPLWRILMKTKYWRLLRRNFNGARNIY